MSTLTEEKTTAGMPGGPVPDDAGSSRFPVEGVVAGRAADGQARRLALQGPQHPRPRHGGAPGGRARRHAGLRDELVRVHASSASRPRWAAPQALVQGPEEQAVLQTADPDSAGHGRPTAQPPKATTIPGFDLDASRGSACERRCAATDHRRHGRSRRRPLHASRDRRQAQRRMPRSTTLDAAGSTSAPRPSSSPGGGQPATARSSRPRTASAGPGRHGTVTLRSPGARSRSPWSGSPTYFNGGGGQPDAVSARPLDQQAPSTVDTSSSRHRVPYAEVKQWNPTGCGSSAPRRCATPRPTASYPEAMQRQPDYQERA